MLQHCYGDFIEAISWIEFMSEAQTFNTEQMYKGVILTQTPAAFSSSPF